MRFAGKSVVVTGAATGVGRTIAAAFVREGARLAILDRADAGATVRELEAGGATAFALAADVRDEPAVARALAAAAERLGGRIDVLVNNAGFNGHYGLVKDMPREHFRETLDINLVGTMTVTQMAIPFMDSGGAILNVASNVAKRGLPYRADYVASKWGLLGLTQTLALELAPAGIRVNAVCPGPIEGDRIEEILKAHAEIEGKSISEMRSAWESAAPMNRFIEPGEVAATILFLCSAEASAMTGQAVNVTGGFLMN
jgi:NAD(P)-dependent dehydrogenase (short-subunit alcohol dehydrogenase family)